MISPLATAPVLLCCLFSISPGGLSYLLTILLLIIIEPTELIIFPFTTGLLGLGLGVAFYLFKKRITIILAGSMTLTVGIMSLLFIFQVPILGPVGSSTFSFLNAGMIFIFSFLYSWLWVEIALILIKRLKVIMK
ncbi:hypothetical protein [Ornithinibacillus halotolerans]|uniref:Uncharacterized protein n=1 Tax=Ornithinibacillus halotolerans TaxID=1274357 RepID=A0A916SAK7_9BACI|nr:hypothetical protein [Ornithinibacillus halotolerans]GGA91879.1 hypothetical protein GCM10008025_37930 [Ornithinibacillus halotolerans]